MPNQLLTLGSTSHLSASNGNSSGGGAVDPNASTSNLNISRYGTVVIMAVDEADNQIKKNGSTQSLMNGSSSHLLQHPHKTDSHSFFALHRNSSLVTPNAHPHSRPHVEDEFSFDHIDPLTLRFKQLPVQTPASTTASSSHLTSSTTPNPHDLGQIDRSLEDGFLSDFFDRYWYRVQKGIITAVLIWGLYFINDYQKEQQGLRKNYHETVIIRFTNCGIGLLCALALSTPWIQRKKLLMPVVGLAMITFGVAQIIFGLWDENELDPTYSVIMILIPSTSSTLFKQRFIFTVVFQASLLILYIVITYSFDSFHSASDLVLTATGLFFANCLFAMHAYRREYKMRIDYLLKLQLEREEVRSQNLLLRMLPASVITKLREGSEFIYYKHEAVTLLFSHIHDFDSHVQAMTAMQVIRMLNSLFVAFDELTDIHGVYKVETIGDVYLVAAGCPIEYSRDDHVDAIAAFALDMVAAAKMFMVEHVRDVKSGSAQIMDPTNKNHGFKKKHGFGHVSKLCPINLRIGMNSGAIISGVVGVKYPRFRLMGDVINTASRMSTTALVDQIQLSTKSWELLNKNYFETKYRGEIEVKGKGLLKTYLLLSKVELICPPPKSAEDIQRANGMLASIIKEADYHHHDTTTHPAVPTRGGLLIAPPSAPVSTQPSPLNKLNSLSPTNHVIEMQPTQLPGVPEMLQKLRSGEVGMESSEENSMSLVPDADKDRENSSTPTAMKELEEGLEDVLAEANGSEGDGRVIQAGDQPTTQPPPSYRSRLLEPPLTRESTGTHPSSSPSHAAVASALDDPKPSPHRTPIKSNRRLTTTLKTNSLTTDHTSKATSSPLGLSPRQGGNSLGSDNSEKESSVSGSRSAADMVITAVEHQNTFKMLRLFSFGPMNAILRPRRHWYHYFTQTFDTDPVLEMEFKHVYAKDHWANNRHFVNFMWIFLLPLSIYDELNNSEQSSTTVLYAWLIRLCGIGVGVWFYNYSQTIKYLSRMQQASCLTVTVVGCSYIWTTVLTSAIIKSYGVSFVLMLLCLISMFIGLRFYGALTSIFIVMINWIIAASVAEGTLPGIVSILFAGAVMYLETCWNMENEARHDFVRFRKLYHERMSTHSFLSNMLPQQVFEGLKREDQALVAHEREMADIMFSDIVGFTSISSTLKPEDVVAILNVMFATFDTLSLKHGVYKVETIGDAYVACANVVILSADHTKRLVEFALAIQKATKSMFTPTHQQIVIRVGIHTGSVIAGVVGKKMPRYHLFGETVTIAELMEQKGVPGKVAVSQAAHSSLAEYMTEYECKPLESVLHGDHLVHRYTIDRVGKGGATTAGGVGGGSRRTTTVARRKHGTAHSSGGGGGSTPVSPTGTGSNIFSAAFAAVGGAAATPAPAIGTTTTVTPATPERRDSPMRQSRGHIPAASTISLSKPSTPATNRPRPEGTPSPAPVPPPVQVPVFLPTQLDEEQVFLPE